MHRHFDEQIGELRQKLVLMGTLAESMIQIASKALVDRDEGPAADVFQKEEEVNELQIEVDDRAVKLTALQQPVASDARFLFMASRIATELERIADQAVNICQNTHHLLLCPPMKPIANLATMAEVAQKMVRDALQSFVKQDVAFADRVFEDEKKVDGFKKQIFEDLLNLMRTDSNMVQPSIALLLISRNLERVGDHSTNIAEEVIYLVQGRDVRHHHEEKTRSRPKK